MEKKRILLHICCAPCAIHPLKVLREKGFDVEGIFFNPNIQPYEEFISRQQSVAKFASMVDLPVYYPRYNPELFFYKVKTKHRDGKRCEVCWDLRMNEAALFALKNLFSHFTTTLLVSPYQDIDLIRQIGDGVSANNRVEFYFEDFRPGFRQAHKEAKEMGLYTQKYCGCLYSKQENKKDV